MCLCGDRILPLIGKTLKGIEVCQSCIEKFGAQIDHAIEEGRLVII